MNLFRCIPDGRLDRQYLRVCAVYRLLKQYRVDKARAIELLEQRRVPKARAVVEIWLAGPLSDRGRRAQRQWRESVA